MKDENTVSKIMHEEEHIVNRIRKHPYAPEIVVVIIALIAISAFSYVTVADSRVYIENAQVYAPIISISSQSSGVLDEVKVDIGDQVSRSTTIAEVSGEPVKANTYGLVVDVNNVPGQLVTPQSYIIKVVDPSQLRLIGRVEEDKGLVDIRPGEKVEFTVDAFGSNKYEAIVEEVVPTSHESDIVFSISDKREVKEYDVIARFDYRDYPELLNGMSAKMWIYK